jgi:DNA polymerase type B, organellar and viral
MTKFMAVDGESYTQNGKHKYVLLAANDGRYQFDSQGLSTVRCFEFLLGLPKKHVIVAFGWNYDVNMILRDLDTESLIRLWREGWCKYKGYTLEWIPNKIFTVRSNKRMVKVHEVFGFFQSSFVKALEAWGFGEQESMELMKLQRSSFTSKMKKEIIDYCLDECNRLVDLCDLLAQSLKSAELSVSSWIGAGAIASALLSKEGVESHHQNEDAYREPVRESVASAYFGGRVELFQQGIYPHVWDYDISSAYPSEALKLPSLADCDWTYERTFDPHAEFAIWHCRWSIPESERIMPFPFRRSGQIYYPRNGEGWYHSNEVHAAMQLVDGIEVLEGWKLEPQSTVYPFAFVPEVYTHRAELKRKGDAAEKVLKLGLNSLYGKLAQGVGYQGRTPKFQSFYWAGRITAGTRARVLELAARNKDALVMVATDGVFFTEPIDAELTPGLGGLELTVLDDVFIAQPGIYQATIDGKQFGRSRGFFTREIDFDDLRSGFMRDGPNYIGRFESERFNGLGNLMITGKRDNWRTWTVSERKLSLYPSRKFITPNQKVNGHTYIHHPPDKAGDSISEPYVPKRSIGTMTPEELQHYMNFIQGHEQPLTVD